MSISLKNPLQTLVVAGINYRKSDLTTRGRFALSLEAQRNLLQTAKVAGFSEMFTLSTCNRTEIYAMTDDPATCIKLLCEQTEGGSDEFIQEGYIKNGQDAAAHLMQVTAGLDSQILGDYEIVSQVRQAVQLSRSHHMMGSILDRLVDLCFQVSKQIKNQTSLREGTVSVSFAAVQYIKDNISQAASQPILIVGTGKIGKATARHLVQYLGANEITLINRTHSKAEELARELGLRSVEQHKFEEEIRRAGVILLATNENKPIIHADMLQGYEGKWIIDLSVPSAVSEDVLKLPGIRVIQIDEISRLKDESLYKRQQDIPLAMKIIDQQLESFLEWVNMRQQVSVIHAARNKMQLLSSNEHATSIRPTAGNDHPNSGANERIQKVISGMAVRMRSRHQPGCHFIEALHEFITPELINIP